MSAVQLVSVLGYIITGIVFYTIAEEKSCESEERLDAAEYSPETCVEPWTVVDSMYFSMVTMSTVGYGDLIPSSAGTKVFTIFYIFFGVIVVFPMLVTLVQGVIQSVRARLASTTEEMTTLPTDSLTNTARFWFVGLWMDIASFVLLQLTFAGVFSYMETLGYGDALYHCMVTATTVGYGDIGLAMQSSRVWATIHIALGVVVMATLIAHVDELRLEQSRRRRRHRLLTQPIREEKLMELDRGGDRGVDKCEFVIGMLMSLGAQLEGSDLEWETVEPLVQSFDSMDKTRDGRLAVEDLISTAKGCLDQKRLGEKVSAEPSSVTPGSGPDQSLQQGKSVAVAGVEPKRADIRQCADCSEEEALPHAPNTDISLKSVGEAS